MNCNVDEVSKRRKPGAYCNLNLLGSLVGRKRLGVFEQLEQRQLLAADLPDWVAPGHWHQGWSLSPQEVEIYTPQGPLQEGQRTLLDLSVIVTDELGNELFVEPPNRLSDFIAEPAQVVGSLSVLPEDTFKLHSLPGANHTIYLDFDGHTTTGTTWNYRSGQITIASPAYDPDNDGPAFTNSERAMIQNIWKRIAEDFSPFQVNVTTQDPGAAALSKSGASDTQWGVRVVVTPVDWDNCQCGGFAYRNSFNDFVDEPVYVFTSTEIGVSAASTHEVGHALGLDHDGTTAGIEYYGGHGVNNSETEWGPIMGSGYYANMTTWDAGQYYLANNQQDDWQIITSNNGFGYRTDDHGGSAASASSLEVLEINATNAALVDVAGFGVIERDTDVDWFQFESGAGVINLNINSYAQETFVSTSTGYTRTVENSPFNEQGSNLDIEAKIYDSSLNVVATSNPVTGLSAAFNNLSLGAGVYYLTIDGVGVGDWAIDSPTGYNQSVSRGQYAISGTIAELGVDTPASPFVRITPLGSLVSRAQQSGSITFVGEIDSFTLSLQQGQLLTIALDPQSTLQPVVSVLDPGNTQIATQSAAAAGDDLGLQTIAIPDTGTYTVSVAGVGGTTGRYATRLVLNANSESKPIGGGMQAIDSSYLPLGSGRYAVVGKNSSSANTQFVKANNPAGFIDIAATGTPLNLTDDGVVTITTTVGNSAFPAGSVWVSNNGGILAGGSGVLNYDNLPLPALTLGTALLPFWDDIDSETGNVYWKEMLVDGIKALIVQWDNRPHYGATGNATFQLQLLETGSTLVRFAYQDVDFGNATYTGGASATVGYQQATGSAIQYSYKSAVLVDGDVLELIVSNPEVDEYTIDLSSLVGRQLDIVATGLDGANLGSGGLKLVDPNGLVVATAVSNPLGVPPGNFDLGIVDLGIVDHVVANIGSNLYTLRLGLSSPAEYSLLVTESLVFDTEPNNELATDTLRSLSFPHAGLGHIATATDAVDFYLMSLTAGQTIVVETGLPQTHADFLPLNSLDPELAILAADQSSVLASDQNGLDGKNAQLVFTAASAGTYYLRVSASSGAGEYVVRTLHAPPAPLIENIQINDGGQSRSQVSSLTVTFDSPVNHALVADAFALTNIDTNTPLTNLIVGMPVDAGGKTIVELTFGSGISVQERLGTGLRGNSLADGNYRLDIWASQVKAASGYTLMVADYIFGGTTRVQLDPHNDRFYRLLGDANGDGVRNGIDLNAIIPTLFNPPEYREDLDTNGDGVINGIDLNGLIPTLFGPRRL